MSKNILILKLFNQIMLSKKLNLTGGKNGN